MICFCARMCLDDHDQVVLIVFIFEGSGKCPDPDQGVDRSAYPKKTRLLFAAEEITDLSFYKSGRLHV